MSKKFCMECGSASEYSAQACSSCGESFNQMKSIAKNNSKPSKYNKNPKFIMDGDEDFYIEDDGSFDFSPLNEILEEEMKRFNSEN